MPTGYFRNASIHMMSLNLVENKVNEVVYWCRVLVYIIWLRGDNFVTASCKRPLYPLCPSLRCGFYQQHRHSDKGLKSLTSYRTASLAELERSKTQNKSINCSPMARVAIRNIRKNILCPSWNQKNISFPLSLSVGSSNTGRQGHLLEPVFSKTHMQAQYSGYTLILYIHSAAVLC